MDNSKLELYLQNALDLFDEGKSFSEIRSILSEESLDDELISYIIRLVDEFAVEQKKIEEKIRTAKLRVIFGGLVLGIGFLITYMFYLKNQLEGYFMIIAYTPIVLGLYLIWSGWKQSKKLGNFQPEIDDTKLKLKRRF